MANLYWPRNPFRSRRRRQKKRRQEWVRAAMDAPDMLVLSHGNCLDGITSAVILERTQEGVTSTYAQPSQVAHALVAFATVPGNGRRLVIADLSLQPQDLPAITAALTRLDEGGWKVEWLDHHHKQWEDVPLDVLEGHLAHLRVDDKQKESGATLVQKRFARGDKHLKTLAEAVRDRDLWWNKDPRSETLEFALNELGPKRFARHLAGLEDTVVDATLQAAADRERARQAREAGRILGGARFYGTPPRRVGVVYGWLPRNTGLHELLEHQDCAVAANIRPNGKMSIRSQKGYDVCHKVAARFGGGGHPNASGADLGLKGPRYWMYVLRKGKGVDRRVADAALAELAGA